LGNKKGDQYYALDTSRNMVFLVPASLEKQLEVKLLDLRDRKLLHSLPDDFTQITYHAGSVSFVCAVDKDGKWTVTAPAASKGKAIANWKVFEPLSSNNAQEIIDSPSPSLLAKVDHPAIEIELARKGGGTKTFRISSVVDDSVYVSISDAPGLFKVPKALYDSLIFKSVDDVLS
jgi:hypothetical protein